MFAQFASLSLSRIGRHLLLSFTHSSLDFLSLSFFTFFNLFVRVKLAHGSFTLTSDYYYVVFCFTVVREWWCWEVNGIGWQWNLTAWEFVLESDDSDLCYDALCLTVLGNSLAFCPILLLYHFWKEKQKQKYLFINCFFICWKKETNHLLIMIVTKKIFVEKFLSIYWIN